MSIAVIMRSKDEMPYLPEALRSLREQTVQDVELFAVDSGSTDGSLKILRERVPSDHLTCIRPDEYIPGKVLNDMIAKTSQEIIVFQNADAIFQSTDALEKLIGPLVRGEADATMCTQVTRSDAHFIVSYDYQRAYDPKNIKGQNADFFSAVTCAFRRELWKKNRFPEMGYAEDVAWANACRANGARFQLVTDSVVEHSHNYTLKGLYRKKFRHGVTFAGLYGRQTGFCRQLWECARELLRDFLYAIRKKQFRTIPYNIAYRIVIHTGLYRGQKEGCRG